MCGPAGTGCGLLDTSRGVLQLDVAVKMLMFEMLLVQPACRGLLLLLEKVSAKAVFQSLLVIIVPQTVVAVTGMHTYIVLSEGCCMQHGMCTCLQGLHKPDMALSGGP